MNEIFQPLRLLKVLEAVLRIINDGKEILGFYHFFDVFDKRLVEIFGTDRNEIDVVLC
jgi:hypothetical protein